jgi:uncharacterized protein (DUF433 family)
MSKDRKSVDIGALITLSPRIKNGHPVIAGTGVTVHRVAGWFKLGYNTEEIQRKLPHLSPAQVHAALAHYHANRQSIDRILDQEQVDYDRLAAECSQTVVNAA